MWDDLFLDHPHAVGETYFQHQRRAFAFAGQLIWAGLRCGLHALVPGLCVCAGSETVMRLHDEMSGRRALAQSGAVARAAAE